MSDLSNCLELSIASTQRTIKVGEPIDLTFSFTNHSTQRLSLVAPLDFLTFRLYVGSSAETATEVGSSALVHPILATKIVLPGETVTMKHPIVQPTYVLPSAPGRYVLFVVYENKLLDMDGQKLWTGSTKSNVLTLHFNP